MADASDAYYDPYASIGVAPPVATQAPPPAQSGSATPNLDATMAQLRAGQPAAAPATQTGTIPVIDVGTPTPNAQPGQMGSQFRPIQVGPSQKAGSAALPAAVAPAAQPAAPAAPTFKPSGQTGVQMLGGAAPGPVPTTAAPAAADATSVDPYANVATAPAQSAPAPDPYAGVPTPPSPPAQPPQEDRLAKLFPNQQVRSRTWYQDMADEIAGGMGSLTHGMSMGLDEILDPLVPAIQESLQTGKSFTDAYNNQVMQRRVMRENYEQRNPALGTATELVGSVPATVMMSPLFKAVPAAAPLAEKATTMARNVAASSLVGGGSGFTMTPGDVSQRVKGAEQGAVMGAVMPPAEAGVTSTVSALRRAVTPMAQVPRVAGQAVHEMYGGVPNVRPSPVPSIPLTLPEATQSPEAAAALDTLNAMDVPAMKRQQGEQNAAAMRALMGQTATEPRLHYPPAAGGSEVPKEIASRGSTMATRGVQAASKIIDSEEHRLWNKPSLTNPNLSSLTAKDAVARAVRTLMRNEPGLELAIDESAVLKRTIRQLNMMPEKTAANQLNAIYSRFRRIARDPAEAGDVKLVASRLADAVQDGMANAPEVVGRPPATQAELDAAAQRIATHDAAARQRLAEQPLAKPPPRPQSLTDYLHELGGISRQDASDLIANDLDKHGVWRNVGGKPVQIGLVRKNGALHWDKAREAAEGQGFLPPGSTKDDLIEALKNESRGNPVYRQEDEAAAQYWREADAAANRQANLHEQALDSVNETARQMGVKLTPVQAEHAVNQLAYDPHIHPEQAVMDAVRSDEDRLLQQNANRLAFTPEGDLGGATYQAPLPDMQVLREGVKPIPQLASDLNAARAFTRRKAEVLGHASFDNILRRNSRGNEPVVPGVAMDKFFDFERGVERPGDIMNVSKFLGDIKSEWNKLSLEERANSFDPRDINQARMELEQGTRNYLFGKMMGAITSTSQDVDEGLRRVQWKQAVDWLDTNRDMLKQTGLLTGGQLDLLDRFRETAQMIYAAKQLGRAEGSPTFTRAVSPVRFVDALLGPITGRALTAAGAAAIGALTTHWFGELAIGAMIASEMGGYHSGGLVSLLYRVPRQRLMEKLGEAFRNPTIARDLAQRIDSKNAQFDPQTVQWMRSLLAADVPGQAARTLTPEPQRQPAMAQ